MTPVASFCRNCGKALTDQEKATEGAMYCSACGPAIRPHPAPAVPPPIPVPAAANPSVSPGLAFLLGLMPGVGAIYNGQYAKGLVHAFVFGLFITIMESESRGGAQPLIAVLMSAFFVYMPFEAYHTARKRMLGEPVDEFSSLVSLQSKSGGLPVGPIAIIAVGVVFLLNNLDILHFHQIVRFWPLLLIVIGVYQLRQRLSGNGSRHPGGSDDLQ